MTAGRQPTNTLYYEPRDSEQHYTGEHCTQNLKTERWSGRGRRWEWGALYTDQTFDNLQELLNNHGNALIAKQSGQDPEMGSSDKVVIQAVNGIERGVQSLQRKKDESNQC